MASLLKAIGAGLVVGQGRRIEAAEEAQEKADAIRAQKLQEFDFAKQLQDSKIQAEMKMKEMELGAKAKEGPSLVDFFSTYKQINPNATPPTPAEALEMDARLKKGDVAGAANVLQQPEKRTREAQTLANTYDDTYDKTMVKQADETDVVHPQVAIGLPSVDTVKKELKANNAMIGSGIYNTLRRSAIITDGVAPDPTTLMNATNQIVTPLLKMTTPGRVKFGTEEKIDYNKGQHRFTSPDFVPYLTPNEMTQEADKVKSLLDAHPLIEKSLREANPALIKFVEKYATPKKESNQEGGEVTEPVMPNEVKKAQQPMADLPPVENYPENKILKNPDTGQRVQKINGKWVNL